MQNEREDSKTKWALVAQLKNLDDAQSWEEFDRRYRPLILGLAVKRGLSEAEAKDVAQQTMVSVSKHIGEFVAEPGLGSFRAWLLKMARWRIEDQFRKRLPIAERGRGSLEGPEATSTLRRVPDPEQVDFEWLDDQQSRAHLIQRAMEKLPIEVAAAHYQIFYLLTIEQRPIAEVAQMVGRSRTQIYVIKHRVSLRLKQIVRQLQRNRE
jgi:RNA polymerase sigma-70 factor (ECF subfamily)